MSVTRDKKGRQGYWHIHVKVRGPDGRIREKKLVRECTRSDALKIERELRRNLATGEYHEDAEEVPTVAAFAQNYLTDLKRASAPTTVDLRESNLRVHVLPLLGKVRLDELDARHARRLASATEASGVGAGTVRNVLQTLSNLAKAAVAWGYREQPLRTPRVAYEPEEVDALTDEEVAALLAKIRGTSVELAVLLSLEAGLRRGEVLGLQWRDLEGETLRVVRQRTRKGDVTSPKHGSKRTLPLSERLRHALEAHRGGAVVGLYVVTKRNGQPQGYDSLGQLLRYHSVQVGRHICWHWLRHTHATRLVRAGVHLRVVQELLGHKKITTTERYTHVTPDHLAEAVSRLGRYWGEGGGG